MPKKCESCRHYGTSMYRLTHDGAIRAAGQSTRTVHFCKNELCASDDLKEMFPNRKGAPLEFAREICDREHDGHFVYFEAADPEPSSLITHHSSLEVRNAS